MNIINLTFNDNHHKIILVIMSIASLYFGVKTITSKNPIVSVLSLIALFFFISLYLIYVGLDFIGLSYLLVYIGAVSILFLFILMLINIRTSELLTDNYNSIPLAIIITLLFNIGLNDILVKDGIIYIGNNIYKYLLLLKNILNNLLTGNDYNTDILDYTDFYIVNVTSKAWESILIQLTHISSMGNVLYTNHYVTFIIASLILLLAMVGCIKISGN